MNDIVRSLKARKSELSGELKKVEAALASFGAGEVKKRRKYTKRVAAEPPKRQPAPAVKTAPPPRPPAPLPAKPLARPVVKPPVRKPAEDEDED